MGKNKIRPKKSTKLFQKYLAVITSVILMSVILLCSSYLFLATRHWNRQQIDTLQHNANIIAENACDLLEGWTSSQYQPDSRPDMSLSMICNTMRIMSQAIDADIFITDMNGRVIVCKEMMDEKFHIPDEYRCMIHSRYSISKEIPFRPAT